ncbi:hypothetical protein AB0L64_17550 [Kribbella sp. NPDC051936]|uniref:hypothetical protein n=1 Tax=Kribbella sp. NPDC051936 TaxID=3154946 RepID=UPI0034421E65
MTKSEASQDSSRVDGPQTKRCMWSTNLAKDTCRVPISDDATMSSETSAVSSTDEDLARWAHAWAAAASQTYDVIESAWDAESPATAIGRKDVMAMVLVDAARNVSRGAERLLARTAPPFAD